MTLLLFFNFRPAPQLFHFTAFNRRTRCVVFFSLARWIGLLFLHFSFCAGAKERRASARLKRRNCCWFDLKKLHPVGTLSWHKKDEEIVFVCTKIITLSLLPPLSSAPLSSAIGGHRKSIKGNQSILPSVPLTKKHNNIII